MNAAITFVSYALPKKSLTHKELCGRFGGEVMEKILRVSGIENRRVADENTCASDLALQAAELLFQNSKTSKADIDLIMMATQTPDYLMPTTACILQDKLGLGKTCAAFDINLGCSQYLYGLGVANAWIKSGMAKKVLLLTGDTPTRTIHPMDKSAVALFGDGACATLIESANEGGILDFDFGSDGSGHKDLILPCSGFRSPQTPADLLPFDDGNGNIRANANMYINGFRIFAFAYKVVADSINNLLRKNSLTVEDIDLFIFHQAGDKIIRSSAERLGIPEEKLHFKLADIGNCGGSSLGIALADAFIKGRLKPKQKIVLCAFGVGLSWGSALIEWSGDFVGANFCE